MNSVQAQTDSPSICPDRQLLILDAVRPELLPQAVREQLFEHLSLCEHCGAIYEEVCDADRELADESPDLISDSALKAAGFLTQEQSLQDIWRRIAAKEAQCRRNDRRLVIYRIDKVASAIAACLLLSAGIFWWNTSLPASNPTRSQSAHFVAAIPHQESLKCLAVPAWILQAQAGLRTKGIEAECIDLLMISGDFRQFQFDADAEFDQPQAVYQPSSLQRLARHYGVAAEVLQGDQKTVAPPVSPKPVKESLERWQSALAAAENSTDGPSTVLLLLSFRACTYLAQSRAAAAVWVRKHPKEAGMLVVSSEYHSACEIPARVQDAQAWSRLLHNQAMAATRCIHAVNALLLMPIADRCSMETNVSWRQFVHAVDVLLASDTEGGRD